MPEDRHFVIHSVETRLAAQQRDGNNGYLLLSLKQFYRHSYIDSCKRLRIEADSYQLVNRMVPRKQSSPPTITVLIRPVQGQASHTSNRFTYCLLPASLCLCFIESHPG